MKTPTTGTLVHSFFIDHLRMAKGLRPASISSYRDGLRLFLRFVAQDAGSKITRIALEDLTAERVLRFLQMLETRRANQIRTRNHRLAIIRTFFEYLGGRVPDVLHEAEKVSRIPVKRTPPPATHFLEREEIDTLFAVLPSDSWKAIRDSTLLLFLYNTGARVQETADLQFGHLHLGAQPRVRLHGKGDKWRECPLWRRTADRIQRFLAGNSDSRRPDSPVFTTRAGAKLTRSGIYKIVRQRVGHLDLHKNAGGRRVTPHVFRHTTAVHLLEAGVEVNVIRGWLGHVKLETTNRYAEINRRTKEAALRACDVPSISDLPRRAPWENDSALLDWLDSL